MEHFKIDDTRRIFIKRKNELEHKKELSIIEEIGLTALGLFVFIVALGVIKFIFFK